MNDNYNPDNNPLGLPFNDPSTWYQYRCRTCNFTSWVEDIIIDSFPPEKPGGYPVLTCPECQKDWAYDESVAPKKSWRQPK